jgi:hypothetical protein
VSAYRTTARREGDWWIVSVEGIGVTQARRLEHVEEMARDLVATMEDVPAASVQLEVEVHVNDELDRLREEWAKVTAEAERLLEKAKAGKERLMRQLAEAKLPARDIGRLTGVSHQRVSQVVGQGRRHDFVTVGKEAAREALAAEQRKDAEPADRRAPRQGPTRRKRSGVPSLPPA